MCQKTRLARARVLSAALTLAGVAVMMGSIEHAVRKELRAHHRRNTAFRALSGHRGYLLYRLFRGVRWIILPFGFVILFTVTILWSAVDGHNALNEYQETFVQNATGYLLSAQVTLFAVAIPVVIAGAQLLLGGRSSKGRELDLAVLLEFGRPREIAWSSLLLTAVLIILLVWPHEVIRGSPLNGARPYLLGGAVVWFLGNLAGYSFLVRCTIDLISSHSRVRMRKRAIAWGGFHEEVGRRIRTRAWYEFRKQLDASGLAWNAQQPPQGFQWFGFSAQGTIEDVRTVLLRAGLTWIKFRSASTNERVGIAFYLCTECKPGRQFVVRKPPDLIARILLRASLRISSRAQKTVNRFQPRDVLDALGSDAEHQVLTGTPADARAAYDELLEVLHALLAASGTEDGNYAIETPLMSLLRDWVRPVHSVSWAAGAALNRSPDFPASVAERLAQACGRAVSDGLSPEIARAFTAALGVLQYATSRRSNEEGRLNSAPHMAFLKRSQQANDYLASSVRRLPEIEDPWQRFTCRAEMRLIIMRQLAINIGNVAWIGDLKAFERYSVVYIDFVRELGPSISPRSFSRLPDELWKWSKSEISELLSGKDTVETIITEWNTQISLDHLLFFQLIWMQWFAEGVKSGDSWVELMVGLMSTARGESPQITRRYFSFEQLICRFLTACQANPRGHRTAPLNEFVHDIDRVRDSDKEGGFYYSDAVRSVEDLTGGVVVLALISFNAHELQRAKHELINLKRESIVSTDGVRAILWEIHDVSLRVTAEFTQDMKKYIPDVDDRLVALQSAFQDCAQVFGENPNRELE